MKRFKNFLSCLGLLALTFGMFSTVHAGIYGDTESDDRPIFKVVLLGDTNVGKTSIINRLVKDEFDNNILPTVQVQSEYKFDHDDNNGRFPAIFKLMDTAGQEQYNSLTVHFVRDVDFALLVCSMDQPSTVDSLVKWITLVRDYNVSPQIYILVNKLDKGIEKLTQYQCAVDNLAQRMGIPEGKCFFVSAKTGENLNDFVNTLVASAEDNIQNPLGARKVTLHRHALRIDEDDNVAEKSKNCCRK